METKALTTKDFFNKSDVKQKFEELLGKRAPQFITSVLQIANSNVMLAKADPISIYNSAAMAATLDLPLNNSLGFAYIVPYNNRQPDGSTKVVAQFQIGYKGFIQLSQRSGQFQTISAAPIYDGQLVEENPLTGFVFDFTKKKSDVLIGYAAYFRLVNGFEKTLYMTIQSLQKHGQKYSKTFNNSNGLWKSDPEAMYSKTVLKLLLSRFAPLSIEMQRAIIADQGVIHDVETDDISYVDNEPVEINKEAERIYLLIQDCKTEADLSKIEKDIPDDLVDFFTVKKDEINQKKEGAKK
ncbi:MAG: recombinase RecT [Bacteroidales bacterium]|nr:recombinase RecT [Bacteroidales bacterium]